MSDNKNTPSIDTLLENSRWEERVAQAREKREKVLAAKLAAKENAPPPRAPAPLVAPVKRTRSQPAQPDPRPRRGGTLIAMISSIAIGVILGGLGVWIFLIQMP